MPSYISWSSGTSINYVEEAMRQMALQYSLNELLMIYNVRIETQRSEENMCTMYRISSRSRLGNRRQFGITISDQLDTRTALRRIQELCIRVESGETEPERREWSKQEMKDIKKETTRIIKTIIKSKRTCRTDTLTVPTEKAVYTLSLIKSKPTEEFVVCPEDYFKITGGIRLLNEIFIQNIDELYNIGDPTNTDLEIDGNCIKISIEEEVLTKEMEHAVKDVAKMVKGIIKESIEIHIRDRKTEQKAYKAKRKEIREEIRSTDPGISDADLRMITDNQVMGWSRSNIMYKKLWEV